MTDRKILNNQPVESGFLSRVEGRGFHVDGRGYYVEGRGYHVEGI